METTTMGDALFASSRGLDSEFGGDKLKDVALPFARYRFRLITVKGGQLPAYSGSAWRGVFGRALRRAVCVTRLKSCEPCLLRYSCAHSYIFETPVPQGAAKLRRYPAAPHPYVLQPPPLGVAGVAKDQEIVVGITLFGHQANRHLPYIVHAFTLVEKMDIGREKCRFRLVDVQQQTAACGEWESVYRKGEELTPKAPELPEIPPPPDQVRLELLTPLRLKRDRRLVGPGEFAFRDLYSSLLRRLSMMTYFHGEHPLELDFRDWSQAAHEVDIEQTQLRWHDWTRYSARQQTAMEMGGILGSFTLCGPEFVRFWPHLWFGQWLHAGKGTSMGLGQYRCSAASLPDQTVPAE